MFPHDYFPAGLFAPDYFPPAETVTPPVPETGGGSYRGPRFRPVVVTRRPDDDELLFWIL